MNAATRNRLKQAGLWSPGDAAAPPEAKPKTAEERTRAMLAEAGTWIREVGRLGWQQELTRRRAARLASHRAMRLSRANSQSGKCADKVVTR